MSGLRPVEAAAQRRAADHRFEEAQKTRAGLLLQTNLWDAFDDSQQVGAADDPDHPPVLDHRKPLDLMGQKRLGDLRRRRSRADTDQRGGHDFAHGTVAVGGERLVRAGALHEHAEPPGAAAIVPYAKQQIAVARDADRLARRADDGHRADPLGQHQLSHLADRRRLLGDDGGRAHQVGRELMQGAVGMGVGHGLSQCFHRLAALRPRACAQARRSRRVRRLGEPSVTDLTPPHAIGKRHEVAGRIRCSDANLPRFRPQRRGGGGPAGRR